MEGLPVFMAVGGGASWGELEELVEGGAEFRTTNQCGQSILHVAAKSGNVEALAYFLSKGVDVHSRDIIGWTPLMNAVHAVDNFVAVVDLLLEHGADINAADGVGKNLIYFATFFKEPIQNLEALVTRGANWRAGGGATLHIAVQVGYLEALQLFLSGGADVDVNARGSGYQFGRTLLMSAASSTSGDNFEAIAELLIAHGADWRLKDSYENSVLHWAAQSGNVEAVKFFIAKGVDVNGRNMFGKTPLLEAASAPANFVEVMEVLIENGGDISAVDEGGCGGAVIVAYFLSIRRTLEETKRLLL